MPKIVTTQDRILKVKDATAKLESLTAIAIARGDNASWAAVEEQGATVHRQSRILAGKPRGG